MRETCAKHRETCAKRRVLRVTYWPSIGISVDVDGCLRLTTSVLARAVTVEMPAEDAPGDFDDGNDANYKLMLDEEEDSQPGPDDGEPDVDG